VKIGPVDSFAQFKKRKKLMQAKYIARSAGLPSGLKNGTKLPTTPALIALSFQYGMGYCYLHERVNSVNDASKSC